jgi:hypothetical protein
MDRARNSARPLVVIVALRDREQITFLLHGTSPAISLTY